MFFTNSCGIVIRLSRNFFCKEPKGWCKPAKKAYDLVQRKRKIKALRGSVHQLRSPKPAKKAYNLMQRKRKMMCYPSMGQ